MSQQNPHRYELKLTTASPCTHDRHVKGDKSDQILHKKRNTKMYKWCKILGFAISTHSSILPLSHSSGGSMWWHVTRHRRIDHQPGIPCRVWQQPGLYMVNPRWARGHYSSRLQWLLTGGQIRLSGNQRDGSTEHMVRCITCCNIEPEE